MRSVLLACLSLLAGHALAGPIEAGLRGRLAPLYTPPAPPASIRDPSVAADDQPFTVARHHGPGAHLVPDSYIVVLHPHVQEHEHAAHVSQIKSIHLKDLTSVAYDLAGHVRDFAIGRMRAYHGHFSEDVLEFIRASPEVAFVERDSYVYATDIERGAPWGLARISHREALGFGNFNKYGYEHEGGTGVNAYVIDTGVNIKHVEFHGRAHWGKTIPAGASDFDGNGHGTHVAGTIGSKTYGVAKNVTIIAVKVLGDGGSGTMADVVGGVDWATKNATTGANKGKRCVANMSLGGGKSPSLDLAVDTAVEAGLHFAVAAGNDNRDACTFSPAASVEAVTVGASTIGDEKASFSNHGSCVDVFAPGLNIKSTWNTGETAINTISGTSMASPHVAGLLAYYLSLYPTSFSPSAADFIDAGEAVPQHLLGEMPLWRQVHHQIRFDGWLSLVKKGGKSPKDDTLSPRVLKKALIRIASSGILTGAPWPAQTVNKLIFNNYTSY